MAYIFNEKKKKKEKKKAYNIMLVNKISARRGEEVDFHSKKLSQISTVTFITYLLYSFFFFFFYLFIYKKFLPQFKEPESISILYLRASSCDLFMRY